MSLFRHQRKPSDLFSGASVTKLWVLSFSATRPNSDDGLDFKAEAVTNLKVRILFNSFSLPRLHPVELSQELVGQRADNKAGSSMMLLGSAKLSQSGSLTSRLALEIDS